jgi:DNA-binding transcriptional ArsR family regulator
MSTLASASLILRALAHPHRLKLVELLLERSVPVGELARTVGLTPAAVSQHLSHMRAHGILASRRVGRAVLYEVANPNARQVIKCLRQYGDGCGAR